MSDSTSTWPIWATGIPDVPTGGQGRFWCAYRGGDGKVRHTFLCYCNAHIMPLSDSCYDVPANVVPVGDGDYAWTGWFQESCEQCDTQWTFSHEVIAWMKTPQYSGPV